MLRNQEIILLTCLFALGGLMVMMLWYRGRRRKSAKAPKQDKNVMHLECTVCHRDLVFNVVELVPLSCVEIALIVRSRPGIVGRKLGEYVCPHCEAAHCFAIDVRPPVWLGANFYQPQTVTTHCFECRRQLQAPAWPKGQYDGQVENAPAQPSNGLVCPYCHSVCCIECCQRHTLKRTPDGSLACPRCSRYPMTEFFHP